MGEKCIFPCYLALLVQFDQLSQALANIHPDSITKLLVTLDGTENLLNFSKETAMTRVTFKKIPKYIYIRGFP